MFYVLHFEFYMYLCALKRSKRAQMAESVDALVSNTNRFTPVPVRPRLWVQKTLVEQLLRGFLLFKTSKLVTFGHPFKQKKTTIRQSFIVSFHS